MARPKTSYNKALVKRANERLRKLNTVYGKFYGVEGQFDFANMSSAYRTVKRYAERNDWKGKIYRETSSGNIAFITEKEFNDLSDKEKRYFMKSLTGFLESETSTKMGVERSYIKAYESFKENHPGLYDDMTFTEYMDMWKTYEDQVKPDESNHYDYSLLQMFINNGLFNSEGIEQLSSEQAQKSLHYMNRNADYSSSDHKFMSSNTIADRAPRRPK